MTKYCASCRRGENTVEADVYVEGTAYHPWLDGPRPYRAYLCNDHRRMMEEDGAEFRVVRRL